MTARIVRVEVLALAALALAACSEDRKDLLAPNAPDKAFIVWDGPILRPVLPNPDDFMEIGAGGDHTCARQYDGDVYCWGLDGEAGYQHITFTPARVFQGAKQIAVGGAHACALNSAGAAFCWGGGQSGQLGIMNGGMIGSGGGWVLGPSDPNVSGGTLPPLSFANISASGNSTCGVTTTTNLVFCWGKAGDIMGWYFQSIPRAINTPNGYTISASSVAIGNQHACVYISYAQEVDCWGADQYGQAGSDPKNTFYYPNTSLVLVAMGTGLNTGVKRLAAQTDFNCADMWAGTVQCFGINYYGELGNGSGSFSWSPVAVGAGKALHGVATGANHACALDINEEAWCWGRNNIGQVGNGTTQYYTSGPEKVLGVSTGFHVNGAVIKFRALAAGRLHTCGIGQDNHIYCWGSNGSRQLGTWLVDSMGQSLTYGWVSSPVLVM